MHQVNLKARKRIKSGKEECKKFRRMGEVPGIIYGKNFENVMVAVDALNMSKALSTSGGTRVILNIEVDSGGNLETYTTMVADFQKDVFQKSYIHVDFQKISLTEKVSTEIPIRLVGEAKGVKAGGMMDRLMRTVSIEGLPLDIPEVIDIDVTHMEEHDQIFIRDLEVSDKVEILNNPDDCIAVVHPPRVISEGGEEAEGMEEGEEGAAEGATAQAVPA